MAIETIPIDVDEIFTADFGTQVITELKRQGLYKGDEFFRGIGRHCSASDLERYGTDRFDDSKLTASRHGHTRSHGLRPTDTLMVGTEYPNSDCENAFGFAEPYLVVYDPKYFDFMTCDCITDEDGSTVIFRIQKDRARAIKAVFEKREVRMELPQVIPKTDDLVFSGGTKNEFQVICGKTSLGLRALRPIQIHSVRQKGNYLYVDCEAFITEVSFHFSEHLRRKVGKKHRFIMRIEEESLQWLQQTV